MRKWFAKNEAVSICAAEKAPRLHAWSPAVACCGLGIALVYLQASWKGTLPVAMVGAPTWEGGTPFLVHGGPSVAIVGATSSINSCFEGGPCLSLPRRGRWREESRELAGGKDFRLDGWTVGRVVGWRGQRLPLGCRGRVGGAP